MRVLTRFLRTRQFTQSLVSTESGVRRVALSQVPCPYRHLAGRKPNAAIHITQSRRTIVYVLERQVVEGRLRHDAAQRVVAKKLQRLQRALQEYDNEPLIRLLQERREAAENKKAELNDIKQSTKSDKDSRDDSPDSPLSASIPPPTPLPNIPRGLYIYGAVGTGKSMLMDMFYANTTSIHKKQRFHFHAFMSMVHQRIHALKQQALQTHGRNFAIDTVLEHNPVYQVGLQLSEELALLCLDEFQVTDIADALILRLLFSVLWSRGTVVVATSNRPPRDLYQGGINFGYFEPFIGLLEKHCVVCAMENESDYRSIVSQGGETSYFSLLDDNAVNVRQRMDALVASLRGDAKPLYIQEIALGYNRTLIIPEADDQGIVAKLGFEELCLKELGASDYRTLAKAFDVLVIERIPVLTLSNHDAARRFITLIDEMYENQTGLICSAAAARPDELFIHSFSEDNLTKDGDDNDLPEGWMDQATRGGHAIGALASVQELGFAFQRAASRLKQMTSPDWWNNA